MHRGEVWDGELPGVGRHPFVVVSRERALPLLTAVVCVMVTTTARGHVAEVPIGADEGLDHDSAANCDNLCTVAVRDLRRRRGALGPVKLAQLDRALRIALDLD